MMANLLSLMQAADRALTAASIPDELALLADLLIRTAAIIAIAWIACSLLRRRSAAARHLIWTASLAAVLIAPATLSFAPKLRIPAPWLPAEPASLTPDSDAFRFEPLPANAANDLLDDLDSEPVRPAALRIDLSKMEIAKIPPAPAQPTWHQRVAPAPPPATIPWPALFLGVWALGALLFLTRILAGNLRLRAMARAAAEMDADCYPCSLEPDNAVEYRQSSSNTMPMTWGWTKPVVLLPANFEQWDKDRQAMTLRHELAHVKRADWLTQTLAQVVRAVYWFHPLVWLAHDRMRMEADRASDDMVLRAGVKASGYAGHLVRVAREFRTAGLRPWVAIAMAHPSSLDQRIEYVLDDGIERGALGSRARLGIALSAAAIVFAVSSVEAVGQSAVQDQQPGSAPVVALTTPDRAQHEIVAAPSHEELPALAADAQWTRLEVDTALLAQAQTTPEKPALGSPDKKPTAGDAKPKPRYAAEIADKIQDLKRRNEQPALSPEATNTAAAALRKALNSPDVQVRKHAAEALGRLRSADEANLEALSKALNDKEPEVQKEAIESLSRLMRASKADPARMVALLATGVTSSDADVRQEAAQALGRLRGPAAVEALTKLVDDKDVEVQREAIESLGRVLRRSDAAAARASLPVLQRALQHQNPEVRRQLVETLGGLRQIADEVVPLLAKAAEDPDPNVQREAVEALGRISSRDKFEYVGEDWDDDNSIGDSIHQGIEKAIEGAIEGTIEGAIENAVPIDYLIEHDKFIQNQERVLRQLEKNQWFRDNNEKRLKDLQSRAAGNE